MDLKGKNAIVTGGANGVGRGLVERLFREGVNVGVLDIDSTGLKKLQEDMKGLYCASCDVTDSRKVKEAIGDFCGRFKTVDILVNNAAMIYSAPLVSLAPGAVKTHDVAMWDRVIATNLSSVFYSTVAVVEKKVANRTKGVIVNIGSVGAAGNPGQSPYSASKAAVSALTAVWSKELGPFMSLWVSNSDWLREIRFHRMGRHPGIPNGIPDMKKAFLVIMTLALLVTAGLWIYIQSDGFAIRIRPVIVGPLQEALGPGARIGRIKANLLPLYVEVRDITVPSPRKQETVAVRRIRVYLNPFPLIYRTISLSSITVLEPRFAADRSANGEIDLADMFRSVLANIERMRSSAQSASPYTVQIRTVTVRNGQVALSDDGSRSTISLSRMNLRAKLNLPSSSASIRLTSGDLIISTPAFRNIEARVRSAFSVVPGKMRIDSCEIVSEDTQLAVSGSIGLAKEGDLDLKLTTRVGQRSLSRLMNILGRERKMKRPALETVAQVTGNLRDPVVNGSLRLSGIVFPGIEIRDAGAEFAYRSRVMSATGRDWILAANARQVTIQELSLEASYDGATVEVMRAVGRADDAVVRVSGSVSPSEGYRLAVELASADRGRTLSLLSGISVEGAVSVRGTLAGPLAAPGFDGQLAGGPVTVRRVAFTRVSGSLAFRDSHSFLVQRHHRA